MGGYAHLDQRAAKRLRLTAGLSLLGEAAGDGSAVAHFTVRRGDGQVVQLYRLPYLSDGGHRRGRHGHGHGQPMVTARFDAPAPLPTP